MTQMFVSYRIFSNFEVFYLKKKATTCKPQKTLPSKTLHVNLSEECTNIKYHIFKDPVREKIHVKICKSFQKLCKIDFSSQNLSRTEI